MHLRFRRSPSARRVSKWVIAEDLLPLERGRMIEMENGLLVLGASPFVVLLQCYLGSQPGQRGEKTADCSRVPSSLQLKQDVPLLNP
jgi:hypothetical protein